MREDDNVLLVCNPADAIIFIESDRSVMFALVMTDAVDVGTSYVVKREDFLAWLDEKGDKKTDWYEPCEEVEKDE